MLCIHNWSKYSGAVNAYSHISQCRVCQKCGAISWRKIGDSIECGDASKVNNAIDNLGEDE